MKLKALMPEMAINVYILADAIGHYRSYLLPKSRIQDSWIKHPRIGRPTRGCWVSSIQQLA